MSLIVMGISHRSAPMSLLERLSLESADADALTRTLMGSDDIDEVALLATCNRIEIYADVSTFHGAVAHVATSLAEATGVERDELNEAFYVHYEDRAISHVFTVACGLEAMAVGEAQILGQMRGALARGQALGEVGSQLNLLLQYALRVGKRAHSDTELDRYGSSLVEVGFDRAEQHVGDLGSASVLVVGAGAMSSLVATTASRRGVGELRIVNRTPERSMRLASATGAHALDWTSLEEALATADVVVSCTGAIGHVIDTDLLERARASRTEPLALVDLALPRDVDPDVAELPDTLLLALEDLGEELATVTIGGEALRQVEELVVAEVSAFLTARRQESVGPAVAALRRHAASVVSAEMTRLEGRLPDMDDVTRGEVKRTVHRVVEKLLHTPTVRVKELTANGNSASHGDYAQALRELFDLDHVDVSSVARAPRMTGREDLA
ncbi:MAG: glutamyl-tRNA reductase [Mobilicoccus sp.]|nr:glutamyl-tRNA reductase [Mobilicoccus sp.]